MIPPRLHVLTATQSPLAVILRRGPGNAVATYLWNRKTDEISDGQWLGGRIYEHRADLSPDGQHMVYFTTAGGRARTVVSRAPWLRALVSVPQDGSWGGGGAFIAPGRVWLNGSGSGWANREIALDPDPLAYPSSTDGFHMGDTFATMQATRGWAIQGTGYDVRLHKTLDGGATLTATVTIGQRDRGLVSLAYDLPPDGPQRWTWAECWADGLHFAEDGVLWFARADRTGALRDRRPIRDFGPDRFTARPAPYDHEATP